MTKKIINLLDISTRVLKDGKPLDPNLYTWDAGTRTFSTKESGITFDFGGIDDCTFKTGGYCTFTTGGYCTFTTEYDCTFKTGSNCTFTTEYDCTFKTGGYCTFTTGGYCTFTTEYDCTFKTGGYCTFTTGKRCVIVRHDLFNIIQPKAGDVIQLFPYEKEGHLVNGLYNGKPHIIADGIVSEIVQQKGDVYKVKNLGKTEQTWLVRNGEAWAHGDTLKEARESLIYKITEKDTSKYKGLPTDTPHSLPDIITMYRSITGACASGVRDFVENQTNTKNQYTIAETIVLTKGRYGHKTFKQFFGGRS
jgi:hypothetical protein